MATIKDLQKAYPEYEVDNEEEEDRLEAIKMYTLSVELPLEVTDMPLVSKPEGKVHQRRKLQQKVC